jgi:hypothetical protein
MGGSWGRGIPPLHLMPLDNGKTVQFEELDGGRYLGLVFNKDNYSKNTQHSVPDEMWSWKDAEALPSKIEDGHALYIMARTRYLNKMPKMSVITRMAKVEDAIGDIDRFARLIGGRDDVTFTEEGFTESVPNHGEAVEVKLQRGFWWKNGPQDFGNAGFEEALYSVRHCYPLEKMTVRLGSDLSRRWQWLHVLERDVMNGRINYFLMAKAWIDLEILQHLGENVDALFKRLKSIIREPITSFISISELRDMDPVFEEYVEDEDEVATEEVH